MLRSLLVDAAVAAAKSQGHARVEPRHVWFAVARHFRARSELSLLVLAARRALEPAGSHLEPPVMSPEAEAALDTCRSESDAVSALQAAIQPDTSTAPQGVDPAASAPGQPPPAAPAPVAPGPLVSVPAAPVRESTSDVLKELDALVGLAPVKQQIRRVLAVVQANEQRSRAGLSTVSAGLHLVFTGPPGTGKTTVARLVARLYAAMGVLPGSKFVEASGADLVAGYVGQTAPKTEAIVARTRPGVLFIDEAYTLAGRDERDFGTEAVATLLLAMENHRQDFAVIVAGYRREMTEFVASNPGLTSRFKTIVEFPHYSSEELLAIFEQLASQHGIRLGSGVRARAEEIFRAACTQEDFGNARFVRSLFEDAYARMSVRAAADGIMELHELHEFLCDDLCGPQSPEADMERRIGFAAGSDP